MQEAVVNKIKSKIAHCKFGEVFFVSSFPQYDVNTLPSYWRYSRRKGLSPEYQKVCMSRHARLALAYCILLSLN